MGKPVLETSLARALNVWPFGIEVLHYLGNEQHEGH